MDLATATTVYSETSERASVTVHRTGSTLDTVRVAYVVIDVTTSSGSDFTVNSPSLLTFAPGVASVALDLVLLDDETPELDETFIIALTGVTRVDGSEPTILLASTDTTSVFTVTASDDPHGIVRFSASTRTATVTEDPATNTAISLAMTRGLGVFGRIEVAWSITGSATAQDVTPSSGIVVFDDRQGTATLVINVVADAVPELAEAFTVELESVSGGAKLDAAAVTFGITIPANNEPNGIVQLSATSSRLVVASGLCRGEGRGGGGGASSLPQVCAQRKRQRVVFACNVVGL